MAKKRKSKARAARAARDAGPARAARASAARPQRGLARLLAWPAELMLRRIAAVALLVTLGLMLVFAFHDQRLSPYSIVSLELAWTAERALEMFEAWGRAGQQVARQSLLIDLAFMPAYAVLFAGLVVIQARQARGRWQSAGLWLALAPFAAWLFDLVENAALWRVLARPESPPALELTIAGAAAALKFGLLLASVSYLLAMLLRRRLGRR
jgi:hypothetical protein